MDTSVTRLERTRSQMMNKIDTALKERGFAKQLGALLDIRGESQEIFDKLHGDAQTDAAAGAGVFVMGLMIGVAGVVLAATPAIAAGIALAFLGGDSYLKKTDAACHARELMAAVNASINLNMSSLVSSVPAETCRPTERALLSRIFGTASRRNNSLDDAQLQAPVITVPRGLRHYP